MLKWDIIKQNLQEYHSVYHLPVKGSMAENLMMNLFEYNNYKVAWEPGSHKQGSDILVYDDNGRHGCSIKSTIFPFKGEWFSISSYRTGKHKTLDEKISGIAEIEKGIDSYGVFGRMEKKLKDEFQVNYLIYFVDPTLLKINNFKFEPMMENGDYKGMSDLGVRISIRKSQSEQVWYDIPTAMLQGGYMTKLCEVGPFSFRRRLGGKKDGPDCLRGRFGWVERAA